jgi:2-dehydro-3-deoxygalactonokinase
MQQGDLFIAGDWGTSHLRLALCQLTQAADPVVLARAAGPGAGTVKDFPAALFAAIAPWRIDHGPLPVLMCGMVGSSIGWVEAPYLECPADLAALGRAMLRMQAGPPGDKRMVAIAPGLACVNFAGAPDVMRGEETQILGAMRAHPSLRQGRRLLCLPGTHSKWAVLAQGSVVAFHTCLTGELFAALRQATVLGRDMQGMTPQLGPDFDAGALRALKDEARSGGLAPLLFEARSRRLRQGMTAERALSFLSGLLIAADVSGVLSLLRAETGLASAGFDGPATLIGAPELTNAYARCLDLLGIEADCLHGDDLSLAGLTALAESLSPAAFT